MSDNAYTDPIYGIKMTHIFPKGINAQATAPATANQFRMPFKAKLVKFGLINYATDLVCSTAGGFELRYAGRKAGTSTALATFAPGGAAGAVTLASYTATGCAPETATRIEKNRVVEPCPTALFGATEVRIGFYMEYERVWDG